MIERQIERLSRYLNGFSKIPDDFEPQPEEPDFPIAQDVIKSFRGQNTNGLVSLISGFYAESPADNIDEFLDLCPNGTLIADASVTDDQIFQWVESGYLNPVSGINDLDLSNSQITGSGLQALVDSGALREVRNLILPAIDFASMAQHDFFQLINPSAKQLLISLIGLDSVEISLKLIKGLINHSTDQIKPQTHRDAAKALLLDYFNRDDLQFRQELAGQCINFSTRLDLQQTQRDAAKALLLHCLNRDDLQFKNELAFQFVSLATRLDLQQTQRDGIKELLLEYFNRDDRQFKNTLERQFVYLATQVDLPQDLRDRVEALSVEFVFQKKILSGW